MTGKRTAHERFPEVIAAAVRVFATDGYRSARMSDVAREAGLSEAALSRYVDGKEDLFVLAIRHALLLAPLPEQDDQDGAFRLKAPRLAGMMSEAREFVAAEVPFGSPAGVRFRSRRRAGSWPPRPRAARSGRRCCERRRTPRRPSSSRSCASCSPSR